MTRAPDFSRASRSYARSRPRYPAELYSWLASLVPRRETAWDTATGSGQAAVDLAGHFDRVIATDVSASQVEHATPHPRVTYRVAPAEQSGLENDSVDLIVAASAVHWFNLPAFFDECHRVIRDGGVLAVWSYHVGHALPPLDEVLWPFYRDVVGPHFADGARLVDHRYEGLELPGRPVQAPELAVTVHWSANQLLDFMRTWSGVQTYREKIGEDPVLPIEGAVRRVFGSTETILELRWPLYIRAAVP